MVSEGAAPCCFRCHARDSNRYIHPSTPDPRSHCRGQFFILERCRQMLLLTESFVKRAGYDVHRISMEVDTLEQAGHAGENMDNPPRDRSHGLGHTTSITSLGHYWVCQTRWMTGDTSKVCSGTHCLRGLHSKIVEGGLHLPQTPIFGETKTQL